jgi:hypothetical protein
LKLKLPRQLRRALRQRAEQTGISRGEVVLEALKQHLETTPPIAMEARLRCVESQLALLQSQLQIGEVEVAGQRDATEARKQAYQQWLRHFEAHPDEIESGRDAHEMAALKAATAA